MSKLLHIIASPRQEKSQSRALASAYIEARTALFPSLSVESLDLWSTTLPEFDGDKVAAKMTFLGEGEMDSPRKSAWDQVVAVTQTFMEADHYVFSVPMWNGGIPYKLKQYIDVITQPGLTFGFSPEDGYISMLKNKRATVFYTAGVFAPGVDAQYGGDFHSTYLAWWLNILGVREVEAIRFQPSLITASREEGFELALREARQSAASDIG